MHPSRREGVLLRDGLLHMQGSEEGGREEGWREGWREGHWCSAKHVGRITPHTHVPPLCMYVRMA